MSTILIIDGDQSACHRLEQHLTQAGYTVITALTGTDGLNRFVTFAPDLVVLDVHLPDISGFTILEDLQEENDDVKVIMTTDRHDMESAIMAMKGGAFDYLGKPILLPEFERTVQKAIKGYHMTPSLGGFLPAVSTKPFKRGNIIGTGGEMQEIFKTIGMVSQNQTTVLIQGESGTGKELIAKVIHHNTSPHEPYIAVNCSAVVENLLESELFGHEKGSFTGAVNRKLGKFELARGGTIFLDEISEMSINLQAKLLRVLQEMEFERVGGHERIRVKARIIAATNQDLYKMIHENHFREDLFYRLNIVSVFIPPLRERREDIAPLVEYLMAKINHDLRKKVNGITSDVVEMFMRYDWPGNIRELENLLVRAIVLAKGHILGKTDFPDLLPGQEEKGSEIKEVKGSAAEKSLLTLDRMEEDHIRKVLDCHPEKNKGEICEILGISRPTLERKLEKYGISFDR